MKSMLLVIIFQWCAFLAYSQSLYLRPYLGYQKGFDFEKKRISSQAELGSRNSLGGNVEYGLLLEYRKNRYSFATGFGYGMITYNYTINLNKKYLNIVGDVIGGPALNSIPFLVGYTLNKPKYKSEDKDIVQIKYKKPKLRIEYELQGGLMYSRLENNNYDWSLQSVIGSDTVRFFEQTKVINRNGLSIMGGIRFALMRGDKPTFTTTLYFNQGLINYADIIINYQINQFTDNFVLGSRGTTYGIYASYPILLKKWKKKE